VAADLVDLGRAPGTIDAYGRGLAEYLQVCERDGIDPLTANRAQVAAFVRELTSRPSRRGFNVVAVDSGAGLANATLQQRLSVTWNLTAAEIMSAAV
jgi:integrase/recombinase XerD